MFGWRSPVIQNGVQRVTRRTQVFLSICAVRGSRTVVLGNCIACFARHCFPIELLKSILRKSFDTRAVGTSIQPTGSSREFVDRSRGEERNTRRLVSRSRPEKFSLRFALLFFPLFFSGNREVSSLVSERSQTRFPETRSAAVDEIP